MCCGWVSPQPRSGEKRWRTTAVKNAGAFTKTPEIREASWSAPVLWRLGRSAGKKGRRLERLGPDGERGWPGESTCEVLLQLPYDVLVRSGICVPSGFNSVQIQR